MMSPASEETREGGRGREGVEGKAGDGKGREEMVGERRRDQKRVRSRSGMEKRRLKGLGE